jgi:phosphate transport system substrate-binding protein
MTRARLFLLVPLALAACGRSEIVVLQDKGSDTMVNLMQLLSEGYLAVEPKVVVAVTGGGSGTGIKSVIDGTTDMANASRPMSEKERKLAESRGIHPHETIIAYDGLAIYAHRDNTIAAISFEELKCIYDAEGACHRWSDLGVTVECGGSDEIIKLGRQNNSGTYEYFKEEVLGKGGKMTNTLDQSGTQQVVDVIASSRCALGYGGMGYTTDEVRFVCLSHDKGGPCAVPDVATVQGGQYEFSRPLYIYTNGAPEGHVKAFLDWAVGPDGQKIALEAGFVPLK